MSAASFWLCLLFALFLLSFDAFVSAFPPRFNGAIFGGRLPLTLAAVTWNAKLKTTAGALLTLVAQMHRHTLADARICAGLTYSSRAMGRDGSLVYTARIELSKKVVDDAAKLRQTFCHELCHAAAWLVRHWRGISCSVCAAV